MIISDTPHHKIDAELIEQENNEEWLQITSFHRKSGTEWVTKVIRLSPEAITNLLRMLD